MRTDLQRSRDGELMLDFFDAAKEGEYAAFLRMYSGNPNELTVVKLSALFYCVTGASHPEERIKIARFLISEGADVNFVDRKRGFTPLHVLIINEREPPVDYLLEMTKLLVEAGADVNAKSKFGTIPLHHLIGGNKLPTEKIKDVIWYLLEKGSDYNHKSDSDSSCVDYAKRISWRNDVLDIIKEFEDGNK